METINLSLLSRLPMSIVICKGKDYIIEVANEKSLNLWGRSNIEVLGKPLFDVSPELVDQGFPEILSEVVNKGIRYKADEVPIKLLKNGEEETLYINLAYEPLLGDDGKIEGFISTGIDVSELVNARIKSDNLFNSLNFRTAVLEAQNHATDDAIAIVDNRGKILIQNSNFIKLWNFTQHIIDQQDDEAALNHAKEQLTNPEEFEKRVQEIYLSRQKSYDILHFKDGRVFERRGAAVIGKDNIEYGWAWYFRDITQTIKEEQKFKNVLEQAPDPILIFKGEELTLEVANDALLKLWDKDKSCIGKNFLDIIPEMKDQVFPELLRNVFRTGEGYKGYETPAYFKRSDGTLETLYFNFHYQPYKEADGKITGIIILATDVSEQVIIKKKLEESEENFRNMILQAPVAMAILKGSSYTFEIINKNMLDIVGKAETELLGKPMFEVLPETSGQGLEELLIHVMGSGETYVANERMVSLKRNDKMEDLYFNFTYQPLREGNNEISGVMVVAVEVTEQVLARKKIEESEQILQQRVEQRTTELKKKNAELEQYAYVSSHDLQEPLRKISIFKDRIEANDYDKLSEGSKRYFKKIEESIERMTTTLKDILNFASLNKGTDFTEVNLNKVLSDVISDLEMSIEQKHAVINSAKLPVINAIPLQMHQMFYNLINNALKFSKLSEPPKIEISVSKVNENHSINKNDIREFYQITFADNGIGFNNDNSQRIFGMFQRLHTKNEYGGTGIGLALVNKVVHNHGGEIKAQGVLGKGAIFTIFIPA